MRLHSSDSNSRARLGASRFEVFLIIIVLILAFDLTRRFLDLRVRWAENQRKAALSAQAAAQPGPEPANAPAPPAGVTPVMVPSAPATPALVVQNVTIQSVQQTTSVSRTNALPRGGSAPGTGDGGGWSSPGRAGGDILLSPRIVQYLAPNAYITIALPLDDDDTNAPSLTNAFPQPQSKR